MQYENRGLKDSSLEPQGPVLHSNAPICFPLKEGILLCNSPCLHMWAWPPVSEAVLASARAGRILKLPLEPAIIKSPVLRGEER